MKNLWYYLLALTIAALILFAIFWPPSVYYNEKEQTIRVMARFRKVKMHVSDFVYDFTDAIFKNVSFEFTKTKPTREKPDTIITVVIKSAKGKQLLKTDVKIKTKETGSTIPAGTPGLPPLNIEQIARTGRALVN